MSDVNERFTSMVLSEQRHINNDVPEVVKEERSLRLRALMQRVKRPMTSQEMSERMGWTLQAVLSGLIVLGEQGELYEDYPEGAVTDWLYGLHSVRYDNL